MNEKKIKQFIDAVMKKAKENVIITIHGHDGALTRFSNNEITQNVDIKLYSFSIRIEKSGKVGVVSGTSLDIKKIDFYLQKAYEIIKNRTKKEKQLLLPKMQKYTQHKNFDKNTYSVMPKRRAELIKKAVNLCKKHKTEAAGILSNKSNIFIIANSNGLYAVNKNSSAEFSITVIKNKSSGWAESNAIAFDKLKIEEKTNKAIEKCLIKKTSSLKPDKYTVILEPAAVADLISFLSYAVFDTKAYIEKRSFLSGKMGKRIMGKNINIIDDPYNEKSISMSFDFEGFPRKRVVLIENGKFINLVHDRKTAKILKAKNTGHSLGIDANYGPIPLNLHLKEQNSNLKEMIESTEDGVLVTRFHYVNILNPMTTTITGMTRNGTFHIKNGKIKGGINNFRFTESIINALNNVELIGDTVELHSGGFWGGYLVPALKINNFNFTSLTKF